MTIIVNFYMKKGYNDDVKCHIALNSVSSVVNICKAQLIYLNHMVCLHKWIPSMHILGWSQPSGPNQLYQLH